MRKDGKLTVAEAKHFRERDFLPDFVDDRLRGLRFKTGCLTRFGITADTTDEYTRMRDFLLHTRKHCGPAYQEAVRDELTEEWLRKLECSLANDPLREFDTVFNLFVIRRVEMPGETSVELFGPHKSQIDAAKLMLQKLCGQFVGALKQIKSFVDRNPFNPDPYEALVFMSGTSSWSMEWSDMWEMVLSGNRDASQEVKRIRTKACELIKMPFELVVGRDVDEEPRPAGGSPSKKTLKYLPFPWTPAG